jgi:hypothetical protein
VTPSAWRAADVCLTCWRFSWSDLDSEAHKEIRRWLDGPGIALITGLPVDDIAQATAGALSVAALFGVVQEQDWKGNKIYLVRDEGHMTGMEAGMIASRVASSSKSRERLDLHNDAAPRWVREDPVDLVVLLAAHQAQYGGETLLVSARAVWEEIIRRDPEAARSLQRDFRFNRSAEGIPDGELDYTTGPVFSLDGDWFTVRCNRFRIETAARDLGLPLTDDQVRALDLMDAVLADPDFQLRFTLQPGECLVIDDRTVVHARTAFRDQPEPQPGRCLIRLWVNLPRPRQDLVPSLAALNRTR